MESEGKTADEQTKPSLRDRFRQRTGRRWVPETLPEIGEVLIRNMTAREHIDFSTAIKDDDADQDVMISYMIALVHDLDQQPLFTEADREWLRELDSEVIAPLARVIRKICGLNITIEAAAKN
jgi:hypothetical protein